MDGLTRKFDDLVNKVEDCVWDRLSDLNTDEKLSILKILDTRLWPKNDEQALMDFGVEEVSHFVTHFASLVEPQGMNLSLMKSMEQSHIFIQM